MEITCLCILHYCSMQCCLMCKCLSFCQCNLHIHGEHSRNDHIVPMLALSEPTAIGLVIAHGNTL